MASNSLIVALGGRKLRIPAVVTRYRFEMSIRCLLTFALTCGLATVHSAPPEGAATAGDAKTTGEEPAAPAAANKNPKVADKPAEGAESKTYTHPITLTGRALDPNGKPIRDARVYLASTSADWKRVAETTTDAEGRYEFREVPLPIQRADTVGGRDVGSFEVFGLAKGFGFTWRPKKWFYPKGKEGNFLFAGLGPDEHPVEYDARDSIRLDLRFQKAATLAGIIVDEHGRALAGATVNINYCEPLRAEPGSMVRGFSAINGRQQVPAEIKTRVTGEDGRFEFTGLPPDCLFWIFTTPKDRAMRRIHAATADVPQPPYQNSPVFTGELKFVFPTPREIRVKVVYGDTGMPAPKVFVEGHNSEASSYGPTDAEGIVTLRLPPGEYELQLLPAYRTQYLITTQPLAVRAEGPAVVIGRLKSAAVVEVMVVDAETGRGIPDVDLWREEPGGTRDHHMFRSFEVETRIARVERPRTDKEGKLQALFEPGKHRIGVGLQAYPKGYEVVEAAGQEIDCQVGDPLSVKFTMRKRAP